LTFKEIGDFFDAALAAGVKRFLYVSVHLEAGYRQTAYIQAHEEFVDALRRSGLNYSVIRPTGIFAAFGDFVNLARKGLTTVIGDGRARTNPVHQADVAGKLLENLESGPTELSVGGPEVFTRREIAELAFAVIGKRPRVLPVPAAAFRWAQNWSVLRIPGWGSYSSLSPPSVPRTVWPHALAGFGLRTISEACDGIKPWFF